MAAKPQQQTDPLAAMARAVVLSKSAAEVELSYDIAGKPVLGQPVEVKLMFVPTADAQLLAVDVSAMQPVQLGGQLKTNFSDVKLGQINPHSFTVAVPKEAGEGVYLANIAVSLTHSGVISTKSFAIPVVFSKAEAAAPVANTPSG